MAYKKLKIFLTFSENMYGFYLHVFVIFALHLIASLEVGQECGGLLLHVENHRQISDPSE